MKYNFTENWIVETPSINIIASFDSYKKLTELNLHTEKYVLIRTGIDGEWWEPICIQNKKMCAIIKLDLQPNPTAIQVRSIVMSLSFQIEMDYAFQI